ncbi:cytochrome c peroxidase [Pararcticibacter amylolyticus]|nr:cytochrome c peroxidase [Pararcticibacter amylolyticus]
MYCKSTRPTAIEVKRSFDEDLALLQSVIDKKLLPSVRHSDEKAAKTAFLEARKQYKTIEYYIEYFFPATAVMLNGAPVDEIELGENMVENPTGFQVMEEILYSDPSAAGYTDLLNEVKKMQLNLKRIVRFNEQYEITDAQLFDAIRLEVFRITGLGITGFDTPSALQSLPEAAAALSGIAKVLAAYEQDEVPASVSKAIAYLERHTDFDGFDRLEFITEYLDPVSLHIDQARKKHRISATASGSALRDNTISLFQVNAFNLNKFVSNSTEFISREKVVLGKALFHDPVLSNSHDRSCASCHHPSKAFSDGLTKAAAVTKGTSLLRNTPTLNYAGLQRAFFYDLKAGSLEDQALDVVHHKEEMNGSLEQASRRINSAGTYRALFMAAFHDSQGKADAWRIQHALASYIRSLAPFNSRFDLYMRSDKSKLNAEEKRGFNLFMGKAKCATCHFTPVFNGTPPPLFNKSEAEVLGVPATPDPGMPEIDRDAGRYSLYHYPQYKHAFKTPTVRNITKTAPYMHNGVYQTLEEVLDFYNKGGGSGIGIKTDNQTLSGDKLNLTKQEMAAIIAFLGTLEDQ